MNTSVITKVESEFDDVYRITTKDGLIIDIYEEKRPEIGTIFEYEINANNNSSTIMNGIVFSSSSNDTIQASFGGFLATVPACSLSVGSPITIVYNLKN